MNEGFSVPVILRAQGSPHRHDLRVHKLTLSLASPVFRDMFSIPQPRPRVLNVNIEVIDVTDPPPGPDLVLRHIYLFPSPKVNNLDFLVEGLVITNKHDVESARAVEQVYQRGPSSIAHHRVQVWV